jgi:hypothetical protein
MARAAMSVRCDLTGLIIEKRDPARMKNTSGVERNSGISGRQGEPQRIGGAALRRRRRIDTGTGPCAATALLLALLLTAGCFGKDPASPDEARYVTAKDGLEAVLASARSDRSDSELAGIYARNIRPDGTIDLLQPGTSQMFYITQSVSNSSNSFYLAVYRAGPTKLPFDIEVVIGTVQDTTARNVLETAFQLLAEVHIDPSVDYSDSDVIMSVVRAHEAAASFYAAHDDAATDLYLVPTVALSVSGVEDSADWIANLRSSAGGNLVLHISTHLDNRVTVISR